MVSLSQNIKYRNEPLYNNFFPINPSPTPHTPITFLKNLCHIKHLDEDDLNHQHHGDDEDEQGGVGAVPAAAEVSSVSGQLPRHSDCPVPVLQAVTIYFLTLGKITFYIVTGSS